MIHDYRRNFKGNIMSMKEKALLDSISSKKQKLQALYVIHKAICKHKEEKEVQQDIVDLENMETTFIS